MKLVEYNNSKNLLFLSGMFAGDWIWRDSHHHIINSRQLLIEEPLCNLGNKIPDLASSIADKITHLPYPVTLVSNSLGGLVSMKIAQLLPDNIERILISGSGGFGEVDLGIRLNRHNSDNIAQYLMEQICFDKDRINPEDVAEISKSFRNNLPNIIRLIRGSHELQASDLLPHVKCPINAIWGENDQVTPFSLAEPVLKQFNIPVHLIDKCGHSPMYERPEIFAKWVNDIMLEESLSLESAA